MTTAARPTFDPARGGSGRGEKDLSALSKQYSSRDLPGHTKLKYREQGQGTTEELRGRDFREELRTREIAEKSSSSKRPLPPVVQRAIEQNNKKQKVDVSSLDQDDPVDSEHSDSDDSDDDTAALLAELNKIKRERAQEQAKRDMEKKQEEEKIRMENILSGNPLLNYSAGAKTADLKVKRRWDDDVVFKNCARSEPERKANNFINDSLRSEFHKKFMEKYIK
uniref:CSON008715 protein n=1 Tax=Culicoides sonorensis TaxID=179676 RepID=A0A336LZ95_CULSO